MTHIEGESPTIVTVGKEEIKKPVFVKSSAVDRLRGANKLKQLALAFHDFADKNGGAFPTDAIRDKNGKALLSWRVALLPFLEEGTLYKQFKLDEPWDSDR